MTVKSEAELRKESVDQIYKTTDKLQAVPAQKYLFEVAKQSAEVVECAMGPLGLRLRDLAEKINPDHPEIGSVMKGIFSDADLSERICQYLQLACYATESKLDKVQLHRACLTKVPSALRSMDSPENSQQMIRLLFSRTLRDKVRGTKSVRPVEMKYILRKGKLRWEQVPENFLYYLRYSEAYKKDLDKLKKKVATYESIGCISIKNGIQEKMDAFSDHMEDTFCGFHRIKMTDAAAIVAKNTGAMPNTSSYTSPAANIFVSFGRVKKYIYVNEEPYSSPKPLRHYRFIPRAYPYVELENVASDEMKKVIDHLEHLPETGGFPAFDHYVVIVPSVAYPPEPNHLTMSEANYAFTHDGNTFKFTDQEECARQLDRVMIQDKTSRPILLGERDGICYFICHWI